MLCLCSRSISNCKYACRMMCFLHFMDFVNIQELQIIPCHGVKQESVRPTLMLQLATLTRCACAHEPSWIVAKYCAKLVLHSEMLCLASYLHYGPMEMDKLGLQQNYSFVCQVNFHCGKFALQSDSFKLFSTLDCDWQSLNAMNAFAPCRPRARMRHKEGNI
jgi:hypothetical protein